MSRRGECSSTIIDIHFYTISQPDAMSKIISLVYYRYHMLVELSLLMLYMYSYPILATASGHIQYS